MKCVYKIDGRVIGDIMDFNDYLLKYKRYKANDTVFSNRMDRAISLVDAAKNASKQLEAKYQEAKKNAQYLGGEEILKATRPFVGVSEFLSGLRNEQGVLYVPEFIASNYWSERYREWDKGNFTPDEIEEFFDGDPKAVSPVPLGNQALWEKDSNGNYKEGFGTAIQNSLKDQMTQRWKMQALYGTAIHGVLQTYFSTTAKGNRWMDLLSGPNSSMHKQTLYNMHTKNIKDPKTGTLYPGLTEAQIDNIIKYAEQLRDSIETQFGKDVQFFPELTLSAKLSKTYESRDDLNLLGRVDLLVIDHTGTPHIVDYKTSPHPYDEYKEAKKLTFTYQLGSYERMLRRAGFNTTATQILVAPIQMSGFRKEFGTYKFNDAVIGTSASSLFESLNERIYNSQKISSNLDEYLIAPLVLDGDTEHILSEVTKRMATLFPNYGETRRKTDEQIKEMINAQLGNDWINKETGQYEYHPIPGQRFAITQNADVPGAEAKFFENVKKYYTGLKERNANRTQDIINTIREAQQNNTSAVEWPAGIDSWFKTKMSKYLTADWEILDGEAQDAATQFGMILLYNKQLNMIDVVKISPQNLHYQHKFGPNRENLTGGLNVDDLAENTKSSSLMLKATNGNIELIEAMLVLNNLRFNTKDAINIGNISVLAPRGDVRGKSEGFAASNNELMYSWNVLNRLSPLSSDDNFNNGHIKMLSAVEQCYQEFQDILNRIGLSYNGRFEAFRPALTQLHDSLALTSVDQVVVTDALNQLRTILEERFGLDRDITRTQDAYSELSEYTPQNYAKILYQQVNKALLDVNGINVRQITSSHSNYLDHYNVLSHGLSGMMLDNAGQFAVPILNQISGMVLEGYQNARDQASRRLRELRDQVETLKKNTGYSGLQEHTIGNQSSLYNGMTYYTTNGDLLFRNPWKHPELVGDSAKVEFLKFALLQFNKDVHPDWSQSQIDACIQNDDDAFFQVPLQESTFASQINAEGWSSWLKGKLKMFKSKEAFKKYLSDKASEFLDDNEEQRMKDAAIFEAVNLMDQGRGQNRLQLIDSLRRKRGDGFFEQNIENLLGAHIWAYATQGALENRMPLLKAAYIAIATAGNDQNWDYSQEKTFVKDLILNRVNHQSIMSDQQRQLKSAVAPIQKAASWAALAFSPVQFTYQMIEGIWKDCKLIFTKPDGKETFTVDHMKDAITTVYRELGHYSDKNTVCNGLNAFYGINDMDKVSFAQNNSSDNHGIFNFLDKFAYKFSSRPDFYNRMTIFVSQMKGDGSWDAHYIDENDQLCYDYKKDKRFKAFATNDHSDEKAYQASRAQYYATARQLVTEGATNVDGTLFKVGDALPKAYSNKESEAMKAVGDSMYGYYDSTKKSMFQATFIGSLMMQMQTYWSAKKNQYLGPGGFKVQGKWVQAKDPDGVELYYAKGSNGDVDYNAPLVHGDDVASSGTPFLQWKGKFEEGVLVTLWDMAKTVASTRSLKEAWDSKWNAQDEDMRRTYQSNLRSLFFDLMAMVLLGGLAAMILEKSMEVGEEAKKTKDFGDACFASGFQLFAKAMRNSTLDFFWIKSIFEPTLEWQPFSFGWAQQQYENLAECVTGDQSFVKTISKSFGAARNIKPMFVWADQQLQE